ncbi:uncharacterized protein EAE98_006169 [Botrytis deweyae]|uniref:Uncharacterized protein n=1 Tax=Botrytis deweyae TaxID=2478750 RepID=A0ABQ7IM30_9HELO|nr:uncharacterized protein EAE98_006169 [Botrytis deweyae]KAF7927787.1 hypothetical protein EAE98_006169 [Botrytis deweyae]
MTSSSNNKRVDGVNSEINQKHCKEPGSSAAAVKRGGNSSWHEAKESSYTPQALRHRMLESLLSSTSHTSILSLPPFSK